MEQFGEGQIQNIESHSEHARGKTTRGFDADIIFVDESEFVPEELWTNTIIPLNSQKKTALLAATTPQDDTTFHAFLVNLINPATNKPVFNVVNLVEVCEECMKTDKPWKCNHTSDIISGSKSQADRDITTLMIRDPRTLMREVFGQQTKANNNFLEESWVERFSKSSVPINHPVRAIYVGVDPGGGGASEMGITAIAETWSEQHGTRLAIVALGAVSLAEVNAAECEDFAIQYILRKLREDYRFKDALAVMAIEGNMGIQASHVDRNLLAATDIPNICMMRERQGFMSGVPINESIENELLFELKQKLRSGYLVYWDGLIGYSSQKYKNPAKVPQKLKQKLETQFRQIRLKETKSMDGTGTWKHRTTITGKSGFGLIDDMADSAKMAVYWRGRFVLNDRGVYTEYHNAIPNFFTYYYPL